jgi:hypothetical protein
MVPGAQVAGKPTNQALTWKQRYDRVTFKQMKLRLMTLLAALMATAILEIVGRFYGFSAAPVLWLFLPTWIVAPSWVGVMVGLLVQASVGWSGWLSSGASSLILCTLGNWLTYFLLVKLAIFTRGKVSQHSLSSGIHTPRNS